MEKQKQLLLKLTSICKTIERIIYVNLCIMQSMIEIAKKKKSISNFSNVYLFSDFVKF